MRLAVIGSRGFVGQALVRRALHDARVTGLRLLDTLPTEAPADPRIEILTGSFVDPTVRATLCEGADAVVHLAAVLGGAAERDYALARTVNVEATLSLFEHLRDTAPRTRVVFASTVAVYGSQLPDVVDDLTPFDPVLVYGAQKLMMEVALSNFAAKGWVDGVSLRPSGIVARPGTGAGLKSAFLSDLFYAVAEGREITLPVAPDSRTWLVSVGRVAEAFLHAALVPHIDGPRALNLPALRVTFAELVAALRRRFPESRSVVRFEPEEEAVALFGAYPAIETAAALRLGLRGDSDVDALVRDAFPKGEQVR